MDYDVFGAQEVLVNQLVDLKKRLTDYDYVGVGRDDGKVAGEFAPIFFKKKKF
ncbi:MAG TPA: endonuclease, partial [Sphingobacterium sp.]|nr:endonuclease [Sphingobacterium sp.]